jgi:hypothetical protein
MQARNVAPADDGIVQRLSDVRALILRREHTATSSNHKNRTAERVDVHHGAARDQHVVCQAEVNYSGSLRQSGRRFITYFPPDHRPSHRSV